MSHKNDYEFKLENIKAIGDDRIKEPNNIPMDIYILEAHELYQWSLDDRETLVAAGLDWNLVEDIPTRANALSYAESIWSKDRFASENPQNEWKQRSESAKQLRNELLRHFRFAFRKDETLSGKVNAIADGTGNADMIQDLTDLSILGKTNPGPLKKINFDMTLLDQASQFFEKLPSLWAEADGVRLEKSNTKKIRDQAYTHLKEAVDEVREYGQYLFFHDKIRFRAYGSAFLRKKRKNQKEKKKSKQLPEKIPSTANEEGPSNPK